MFYNRYKLYQFYKSMVNKLIKNFNIPLDKYRENLTKNSTFTKLNTMSPAYKESNFKLSGRENQISFLLKSVFRKLYVTISKPVYSIGSDAVTIKFLYYIPHNILPKISYLSKKGNNIANVINDDKSIFKFNIEPSTKLKLSSLYLNELYQLLNNSGYNSFPEAAHPIGRDRRAGLNSLSSKYEPYTLREKDFQNKMKFISMLLSKILKTNIRLEGTRIKYPQFDSQIFSEYLGIQSSSWTYGKIKKSIRILSVKTTQAFKDEKHSSNSDPMEEKGLNLITGLTGVNFKLSGRLQKQRIVPRQTVKRTNKGPSAPNKHMAVQTSIFTGKNKKGTYSIRIQTGHSLRHKSLNFKG